jgi:cholesterol transport system auxiliary component
MMKASREIEKHPSERLRRGAARMDSSRATLMPFLAAALVVAFLSGCGAARPSKYYELTVPGETSGAQPTDSTAIRLLIGSWTASHLYRDDRIVYGSSGEEMGTYEYERWAEPPAEMIEEVLLRELRASGRYRAVHSRRSNANGDFLIRGRLYDLKEVTGGSILARVTFEVELRDLKTATTVWTHYYTHDEPVNGKSVTNVVSALDKSVQQGVKEVVAGVDQYFAAHPVK